MHDIPLPSPPTSPPSSPERPAYSWPMQLPPTHFLVGIESPTLRKQYITAMLESCTPSELAFVSETVTALLKRDFLLQLPAELAYHILSFIDEPKTLTRISQVSKYWYRLSRDESTWRRLCILHGFDNWDEAEQDMQMELERKRKKLMYIGKGKGKEKSVTDEAREKRIARYASSSKLSYRRHFKTSWIIRTNWREGGELLNMHRMPIVQPDTGTVTSLALDAEYVVVGFSNAMVKIFSSVSGVLCKTLVGHDSGVWSVCLFSKGGWGQPNPIVVSGGCDKVVRVWDVSSGQCIYVLHGHRATIRCMRVLKNRPIAITGSRDHDLRVWDVQQGKCLRVLSGHQDRVRCMDVSGNKLVSGSYDNTCRLWNIDTGECLHVLQGHFQQVYSVAFDGVRIVSGAIDTTVRVWDAETGHCIALLQGHTSVVCEVHLSPTLLVTGGADGRVIAFSLSNYQAVNQIAAHDSSVTSLQFDDEFLVTGGNDGRVKLYETRTGNFVRELSDRSQSVWKVAFVRGLYAVMCMRGGKTVVEIWSLRPRSKKSQRRLQRAQQAAE
ncbi:WD40 repeat-like protein [Agrocybe pediades]|nr:WD40 repeat-like protein [Agrocybe pediades]